MSHICVKNVVTVWKTDSLFKGLFDCNLSTVKKSLVRVKRKRQKIFEF
jgi:hypothetical protein